MKEIKGKLKGRGKKVAIVVSKFNEFITQSLLEAALVELNKQGVLKKDITVVWVPGAFEIPVVAKKLASKKTIHAVICLGAIIKGETYHFELVAKGSAYGLVEASLQTSKPIVFEILATDTLELAYKRSEKDGNNKGKDAAITALEMIDVMAQLTK